MFPEIPPADLSHAMRELHGIAALFPASAPPLATQTVGPGGCRISLGTVLICLQVLDVLRATSPLASPGHFVGEDP